MTGHEAPRLHVLAGITKLKQICNHPASLADDDDRASSPVAPASSTGSSS